MKQVIEILNRLKQEGILSDYALGEGVAALAYIEPFLTEDIDVFTPMIQISGLVDPSPIFKRLGELGYGELRGDRVVIHGWPVQFLPPAGGLEDEAIREAREEIVEGSPVRVFKAEHLIAIALKTGRIKDALRIEQFQIAGRFDPEKLERILERHGLLEKWKSPSGGGK